MKPPCTISAPWTAEARDAGRQTREDRQGQKPEAFQGESLPCGPEATWDCYHWANEGVLSASYVHVERALETITGTPQEQLEEE